MPESYSCRRCSFRLSHPLLLPLLVWCLLGPLVPPAARAHPAATPAAMDPSLSLPTPADHITGQPKISHQSAISQKDITDETATMHRPRDDTSDGLSSDIPHIPMNIERAVFKIIELTPLGEDPAQEEGPFSPGSEESARGVRPSGRVRRELRASDLRVSELRASELRASNLRASELRVSSLVRTSVRARRDLRASDLRASDLRTSDLRASNPRDSDLRASKLRGSELIRNLGRARRDLRASHMRASDLRASDPRQSDLTASVIRTSLGAHLQAGRRGGSHPRRYPLIKLIRGPWLLAVSPNGTVYTTKRVHDPNTVFVSRNIDNRLVTLEGREAGRFLTFSKKGYLSTSRRMNRRTHFIASTSSDHYLSYLSKHRYRQYWYIGVTDTGKITTYSKVTPGEPKVSTREAKVSSREPKVNPKRTKVTTGHSKVTGYSKVITERSKVKLQPKVTTMETKVMGSTEVTTHRGRRRHGKKTDKTGKAHPTPVSEIVQYSLVDNPDSSSGDMSVSAFSSTREQSPTPPRVVTKETSSSSRRRHHKKTSKRRRGRRKCRTQHCACVRSKNLAPWCRFHVLHVDRKSDRHLT